MKFPSIIKLPKYRQFKYKPRFYDPVMEDLDVRVQRIKREMGDETTGTSAPRRLNFRSTGYQKANSQALVIRLVLIGIMILNTIGYLYLGWGKAFQLILLGEVLSFYLWFRFLRKRFSKDA